MDRSVVLDASALLAFLNDEPGHNEVEQCLSNAMMSTVNVSEVIAVLADIGMPQAEAEEITATLIDRIIPFDMSQASLAASLRKQTKSLGLSLGDRAALSLAKTQHLPVLTADKIWSKLHIQGITVELIR